MFRTAFPSTKYSSETAKHRLLEMPIVAVRVGSPTSGLAQTMLSELVGGVDYRKVASIIRAKSQTQSVVQVAYIILSE